MINSGAFKAQENGRSYVTDGIRLHTGPFIIRGGPVTLPPASVTTEMLVPAATSQLIGQYAQPVSWTLAQGGVWTETPIQVNCVFDGDVAARFTFGLLVACPTKGQRVLWDLMIDGARLTTHALGALDAPENNFGTMATGTYYVASTIAGAHRVGVALNGPAGTQIYNAIWSTLFVTEEKR